MRVVIIVIGVIIVAGILLWMGYIKAWKDFGTNSGFRYIRTYKFPVNKQTAEQRIYNLAQQYPERYALDSGTRFSTDNWFTVRLKEPADSIVCIFRFAGDSLQWSKQPNSELTLLSLAGHGKKIHYSSNKNNNITDTGVLYQVFERGFIDSLRSPLNR